MKVTTIRLPEDEFEELAEEAEDRGVSLSEYVREIVARRDATSPADVDDLTRQVDRLEAIADRLDADTGETAKSGSSAVEEPVSDRSTPGVEAPKPPSSGPYSEVNAKALAFVRSADGRVTAGAIKEHVEDDLEISATSWWRRHGRDALEDAGADFVRNKGWGFGGP